MGRREVCPRYMQPTESSRLRGGEPTKAAAGAAKSSRAAKPAAAAGAKPKPKPKPKSKSKPLLVKTMEGLRKRSTRAKGPEKKEKKSESDPRERSETDAEQQQQQPPCLARTSIPKAPVETKVPPKKSLFASVSNLKSAGSSVSGWKKAAARVIPLKMRAAGMDQLMRNGKSRKASFVSRLPKFCSATIRFKSKIKPPNNRLPAKASKIPKAPEKPTVRELQKLKPEEVMTWAERRHYKLWEGMAKANQQAFGFHKIPNFASLRL